ncbi:MAG: NACHT domain-containing protein [Thermodesulfobacteria bacterium]|nr:NACHT domain-containing protein [Thermodesulfobacteriota bacterium]
MWAEMIIAALKTVLDNDSLAEDIRHEATKWHINRRWIPAFETYREEFRKHHLSMDILGPDTNKVALQEFYIEVNVCPPADNFASRCHPRQPKIAGRALLKRPEARLFILGKPGAGKTSLLKFLAWRALFPEEQKEAQSAFPVFIPLHTLADTLKREEEKGKAEIEAFENHFYELLAPSFEKWLSRDPQRIHAFTEVLLRSKEVLLLFDGLDEIDDSEQRENMRAFLQRLARRYPHTSIIVSSRLSARRLQTFDTYLVAPFDENQIQQYSKKWFGMVARLTQNKQGQENRTKQETDRSAQFLRELQGTPALKDLAKLPLMLNLLCLTFDTYQELVSKRVELYRQATDALLYLWRQVRGLRPPADLPNGERLSRAFKESFFQEVAFQALREGRREIPKKDVLQILKNALAAEQYDPRQADKVLRNFEQNYGILIEMVAEKYSFLHSTFQEYFAANYIKERGNTLWNELYNHLGTSPAWTETFSNLVQLTNPLTTQELYEACLDQLEGEKGAAIRRVQRYLKNYAHDGKAALEAWILYFESEAWRFEQTARIIRGWRKHAPATEEIQAYSTLWPFPASKTKTLLIEGPLQNADAWEEWLDTQEQLLQRGLEVTEGGREMYAHLKEELEQHGSLSGQHPVGLKEEMETMRQFWDSHHAFPPERPRWPFLLDALDLEDLEVFQVKISALLTPLAYARLAPNARTDLLHSLLLGC